MIRTWERRARAKREAVLRKDPAHELKQPPVSLVERPRVSREVLAVTPEPQGHDRAAQTPFEPGRIFLENQGVGGNVARRMGKPLRRLRALLPGKARG